MRRDPWLGLAASPNVELRAEVLRAIAARVRQDAVFAAELFEAIFGGG